MPGFIVKLLNWIRRLQKKKESSVRHDQYESDNASDDPHPTDEIEVSSRIEPSDNSSRKSENLQKQPVTFTIPPSPKGIPSYASYHFADQEILEDGPHARSDLLIDVEWLNLGSNIGLDTGSPENAPEAGVYWYELPNSGADCLKKGNKSKKSDAVIEARALALELGVKHGCDRNMIIRLVNVFLHTMSADTRFAMDHELSLGMTVEELELAVVARDLWILHPEFSVSDGKYDVPILPWETALAIVRSFTSYPQDEEIEMLFVDCHDTWRTSFEQRKEYVSFYEYLHSTVETRFQGQLAYPGVRFERLDEDEYNLGSSIKHKGVSSGSIPD